MASCYKKVVKLTDNHLHQAGQIFCIVVLDVTTIHRIVLVPMLEKEAALGVCVIIIGLPSNGSVQTIGSKDHCNKKSAQQAMNDKHQTDTVVSNPVISREAGDGQIHINIVPVLILKNETDTKRGFFGADGIIPRNKIASNSSIFVILK